MSVSHTPARCTVHSESQLYGMRGIDQRRDGNDGMEGEGAVAAFDWTAEGVGGVKASHWRNVVGGGEEDW